MIGAVIQYVPTDLTDSPTTPPITFRYLLNYGNEVCYSLLQHKLPRGMTMFLALCLKVVQRGHVFRCHSRRLRSIANLL